MYVEMYSVETMDSDMTYPPPKKVPNFKLQEDL